MKYPNKEQIKFAQEYEIKSGYKYDTSKHNFMALPVILTFLMGFFAAIFQSYTTCGLCLMIGIVILFLAIRFRKSKYLKQWNIIALSICFGIVAPIFFTFIFVTIGYWEKYFYLFAIILIVLNFAIGILYTRYRIYHSYEYNSTNKDKETNKFPKGLIIVAPIICGYLTLGLLGKISENLLYSFVAVLIYIASVVYLSRMSMAIFQILILKKISIS